MSTSALQTTREAASSDSVAPRAASAPAPSRSRPADSRVADEGPWYRREAWLAVSLAAFVPIFVGFFTPQSMHVPLLALAALLVIVGLGLLVRRGVTR
jgi:hypothetical protein